MTITFNTNLSALTAQRYIGIASDASSSSLAKLSSGSRIPQAKDDAAGLAIGSKLKAEVAGLTQASNNASQATSLLQIADGALSTIGDILVRMKTLATQSSSGQLGDSERSLLNQEYSDLNSEIDRIAATSNFNGTSLLAGSTSVAASANKISSVGTSVAVDGSTIGNAANSQISTGIASINFDSDVTTSAVKLEYDAAHNLMTMTDLTTGNTSTATVSSTTLAAGQTETLAFSGIGASVTIDSTFNKNVSSSVTNGTREATYAGANTSGTALTTTAGLSSISEFDLKPNGTGGVSTNNFNGVVFTITGAGPGATPGTQSTITATVTGDDGASHAFSVETTSGGTGGTTDLSTAGAKSVVLTDSSGNQVTLGFTVAAGGFANGNTATITGTVAGVNSSRVDSSAGDVTFATPVVVAGNGTAPTMTGVSITGTSFTGLNPPLLSAINGATVSFTSNPTTAAVATVTFGGHTFTGTANFSTTGAKTFTMADTSGNSFTMGLTIGGTYGTTTTASSVITAVSPAIQNNSIQLTSATKTSTSTFDFGSIDRAKVVFGTGTASASTATLTLGNGSTFTASAIDLSTTGTKTVTLTGQGSNAGASLTFSFNLTKAATNGDAVALDVGQLGQLVGVNSTTGGSTSFSFKVGTGTTANDSITFGLNSATSAALGLSGSDVSTADDANTAIDALNSAITAVSSRRADVGASQSRLGFASANISVAIENTTAATSAIMDVDVSSEITNFTSQQVLLQAGVSLEAQANQQPSLLLKLLQ